MANLSKMNFPLLRLPILATFEVLSTMNPFEIINFSMLSMKCKKIVKIFFRSGCKFEVLLHIFANPTISIKGTQSYYAYKFTTEEKQHNIWEYHEEDEEDEACVTLMKYSTNVVESFFNLLKYIDDLMNFEKLELLHFEMCHFPLQNDLIIQEIKNIRKSTIWFDLYSEEDVGNDVIDMLNHVKGIKCLDLSAPFNKDFEIICPPSLNLLQITNSKWINLKKLLEFNSSKIAIRDSELTDMDLCTFFQSWMSSEFHLNLVKFEIDKVERETFTNISQNLSHEEFDDSVVRKYSAYHILQTWEVVLEWFNIKRNDGTWATIRLVQHTWYPDWLTLEMVVEKKEHNILKYHKEDEDDKAYETLMKYSTNVVESSLNLFNYIDDLINFKNLSLLSFEMCHFPRQNDLITQKIRNIRKSIEWFHVYSKEDVGNDVTDLLNHVKGIKSLDLSVPFSKDFEMICPPSLHLLQITNSKWVDLKKLLEFNSSEIALRDSELTDSELCAFFQSWMSSESHLNLVKFEISPAKRETFTIISQSLPHEEIDDGVVRKIHILQTWETLLEWFNIKRNDGTWATIYLTQHAMYPNRLTLGMVVG
ncbi:unnamed protein product [Caenorhabditis brenneri]